MRGRSYTNEQVSIAVKQSTSIRQVLEKLSLKMAGGNYYTIRKIIRELNLDTSHLTGQCWNKDKQLPTKRDVEDYLSNTQPIQSNKLRQRLLREGFFKSICSSCNGTEWLNHPIPLELDHINGNHLDNSLSNLRLLCPNCHALTPTYRGKNKTPTLSSGLPSALPVKGSPNLTNY